MNLQTILKANDAQLFDVLKAEASLLDVSVTDYIKSAIVKELAQTSDFGTRNITQIDKLIKEAKDKAVEQLKELSNTHPDETIPPSDYIAHVEEYDLWQSHFNWQEAFNLS